MKIKTSVQCEDCNFPTETTNHKLYECPAVKSFTNEVLNWWNFKHPENITSGAMEILCSYKPESTHIRAVSHSSNYKMLHPPCQKQV